METVLTYLLIRFAVIAVLVAVAAVVLFGIAVWLKRRGRWDATKRRFGPTVSRAVNTYAERGGSGSGLKRVVARQVTGYLDEDREVRR